MSDYQENHEVRNDDQDKENKVDTEDSTEVDKTMTEESKVNSEVPEGDMTLRKSDKAYSTPSPMLDLNTVVVKDGSEVNKDNEQVGSRPNPNGFFAETKSEKACSVCVAVRVRPLIGRELVVRERV